MYHSTESTFSSSLVTASTDKTVALWDVEVGERIKKLKGHTTFVNSCQMARRGPQLICSGSDDGTIKVSSSQMGKILFLKNII